jgi:phage-related protein
MKFVKFLGDSLKVIGQFSEYARRESGYQLRRLQEGKAPEDFKPIPEIGTGVEEIRIWDGTGTYRVVYTARFEDAIYVLHAFQKKTQRTSKRDIEKARKRLNELKRGPV